MSIVNRSASFLGLLLLFTLVSCNNDQCPVCPPVTQAQEQLDSHLDDLEGGVHIVFPTFDSTEDVAQVIKVSQSGVLNRIEILLTQKSGEGNFRFELHRCAGSGSPPENNDNFLASATFNVVDLPTGPPTSSTSWLSVDVSSLTIPMQNGEYIAIVLRSFGPTVTWWAGDMDPYEAGEGWHRNVSGGSWATLSPMVDFMFRVYLKNSSP